MTRRKRIKAALVIAAALLFLFLFTRPSDYRQIYRDVAGTFEDQWCAWSEPFGHRCDRWRKVRSVLDEARSVGERMGERIRDGLPAPVEDARPRKN